MSATMHVRPPATREILLNVCEAFDISELDIMSKRRMRRIARPRQVVMYLARHLTKLSLPEIGGRLGGLDHTTVLHGVARIEQLMEEDTDLAVQVEMLRRALTTGLGEARFFVCWTAKDGARFHDPRPRPEEAARVRLEKYERMFARYRHRLVPEAQLEDWLAGREIEGDAP